MFKIILIVLFKILNSLAPSYFSCLICVASPSSYNLPSSCEGTLLHFPPMKSSKTLGIALLCSLPQSCGTVYHVA